MVKLLHGQTGSAAEDDAMFTKKYVGPVDCASCEKGLTNMNGLRGD
jgi:hypothetical protein